jgi:DNA replication and repair protein RecF
MQYNSIYLKNYRNYEERAFDFHEKVNILIGENGRGKTNLLESIFLTAYGKSFRTSNDRELVGFEKEFCKVKGSFTREITLNEENEIEIVITKDGKRRGNINGREFSKFSDIFDNVLAVIFSPEDLRIIKDNPEKRRNFINQELSQLSLSYYRNLINYRKVLQQRNSYLKEEHYDAGMTAVWNDSLIKYGSRVTIQRYLFIQKLSRLCKEMHRKLTGEKEEIDIAYASGILSAEDQMEIFEGKEKLAHRERDKALKKTEEMFEKKLDETKEKDFQNKYTGCGPQKDDINIYINGINARNFGSQGQQRTAALSMKLAEIELVNEEKGEYPILLLDDVLSELDLARQAFLINSLDRVQLFISTTNIPEEVEKQLPEGKVIAI